MKLKKLILETSFIYIIFEVIMNTGGEKSEAQGIS